MENSLVNRLNMSVRFLQDGESFVVGEFVLGVVNLETLFVNFYSSFYFI
jgi:hypothetical protein